LHHKPFLLLISGAPGAGKTTLARRLAREFDLPLVAKDDIKELLFDSLGWQDREWSKQLGRATYDLIYYFVETQLAVGRSLIVESNFDATNATRRFRAIQDKHPFTPIQIILNADGNVLVERFQARWASGARHPGHVDHLSAPDEIEKIRVHRYTALDLGGAVIEMDTTNFETLDYAELFSTLKGYLDSSVYAVAPKAETR
jgi:predicted kinase